jgi:3-methyladenine DNA glycosylase/8-oxoguanine DNA glycosylase
VKELTKDLYGMRDTNRPDLFPMLTLAITLQMAPMKRSNQMMGLLIKEYGSSITFDEKTVRYWPSPQTIARASVRELEKKCKLGYRARHLKSIAQSLCKGFPTYIELSRMPSTEAKTKLMQLSGIGEYSVDIVSPHPGFPLDVWSAKIFSLILFNEEPEKPREAIPMLKEKAEERWGEWRGYLFTYVLNDLEKLSRRLKVDLTNL